MFYRRKRDVFFLPELNCKDERVVYITKLRYPGAAEAVFRCDVLASLSMGNSDRAQTGIDL